MAMIMATDPFEAILYASGFKDNDERKHLLTAFAHNSVGITAPTNLKFYDSGGLQVGSTDRKQCILDLVTALKAVDPGKNVLPTTQKLNQLGEVFSLCFDTCSQQNERKLEEIGLTDRKENATGDIVYRVQEIAILRTMSNTVGGGVLPDTMEPSHRIISCMVRPLRQVPPMLRSMPLGMIVTSYGAKNRGKQFQSQQEKMTATDEYDLDVADTVDDKIDILRRIKILLHAISIAASVEIGKTELKAYIGDARDTTVMYNGTKTTFYCTRLLVENVMAHILEWGAHLSAAQLIVSWEKTLCAASSLVKKNYLILPAFQEALKETHGYWAGHWHEAKQHPKAQRELDLTQTTKSKNACNDWNNDKCTHGSKCKYTHKCSACGNSGHRKGSAACKKRGNRQDNKVVEKGTRSDDDERTKRMEEYQRKANQNK